MNLDNMLKTLDEKTSDARESLTLTPKQRIDFDLALDHAVQNFAGPITDKGEFKIPAKKFKQLIEKLVRFNILYGAVTVKAVIDHNPPDENGNGEEKSLIIKRRF